jgi:hypothetical protein
MMHHGAEDASSWHANFPGNSAPAMFNGVILRT